MRKQKVITNYTRTRQDALATVTQAMHDALDANPDFPALPVLMAAYQALIDDYKLKLATAEHGTPLQTAEKNASKSLLLQATSKNGVYINATANGDEVKLQGSGYTMARIPQPVGPFAVPTVFTVLPDRQPGRGNIEFGGQPGAAYLIRYTKDVNVDRNLWPTTIETRRSFSVDGLVSGDRYTFIGAYKGASNVLNFTAPVEVVVQ